MPERQIPRSVSTAVQDAPPAAASTSKITNHHGVPSPARRAVEEIDLHRRWHSRCYRWIAPMALLQQL